MKNTELVGKYNINENSFKKTDRPDNGGSKHLRNVGKLLPEYTAQQTQKTVISILIAVRTSYLTEIK
jgi:hypothetical protein